ncbi:MAG: hypothetical protein MRJ96_09605 [Nitrospirales bacterium]|nr:hypothetical protein [Nitrospira sp.]MDR4501690.1 hypothetical protein [Nitrospirales bacterium]
MNHVTRQHSSSPPRVSILQVTGIIGLVILVTIGMTAWWMNKNIYAAPFTPTELTTPEQHILEAKMSKLTGPNRPSLSKNEPETTTPIPARLEPEAYTEHDENREISLSEKELNALIAKDPETAKYVAVDLDDDLVSVKLLVPMDQEVPLLGGKTLHLNLGVVLKYVNNKPVVAIKGLSLGGVPLPQSWWGEIKNVNLVEHFGAEGGFWDQFSKGVENISIQEGRFRVKLKE